MSSHLYDTHHHTSHIYLVTGSEDDTKVVKIEKKSGAKNPMFQTVRSAEVERY